MGIIRQYNALEKGTFRIDKKGDDKKLPWRLLKLRSGDQWQPLGAFRTFGEAKARMDKCAGITG